MNVIDLISRPAAYLNDAIAVAVVVVVVLVVVVCLCREFGARRLRIL